MRWAVFATLLLATSASAQFCPSYSPASSSNPGRCAIAAQPGTNPTLAEWQTLFATVSRGPTAWGGLNGPTVSSLTVGCERPSQQSPRFPCELLKAIAMQESLWQQFCRPTQPSDQVGRASQTIIASDCGYGVGQVTSGMRLSETPTYDRMRVANDPFYNLATSTQLLSDKWRAVQCVGDRSPTVIEHWYSAAWAYNGLAYVNNPTNPMYSSTRGVWNPTVGGSVPYQERIFGRMEHPPSSQHWAQVKPAYPNLLDIGGSTRPNKLPDPSCAGPTTCSTKRALTPSECGEREPDAGMPAPDAGQTIDAGVMVDPSDGGSEVLTPSTPLLVGGAQPGCGCTSFEGLGIGLLGVIIQTKRRAKSLLK